MSEPVSARAGEQSQAAQAGTAQAEKAQAETAQRLRLPDVQAALAATAGLAGADVDEHVAAFETAHAGLRRALDTPTRPESSDTGG